jgi:hypothetical protein
VRLTCFSQLDKDIAMDVIEGRGVKALVYNPNKYERVSIFLHVASDDGQLTPPSSVNATTRSPTTPSRTCKKKASSTTCSKPALPVVLLRRWILDWANMEAMDASRRKCRAIRAASLVYFLLSMITTVPMAVATWAMLLTGLTERGGVLMSSIVSESCER